MSKQIGSFILPDNVVSSMKRKIQDTKKLKTELGFALCAEENSNIVTQGPECTGTRCSIKAATCNKHQTQIGDYHIHPRAAATMSITDMVTGCSEKMEYIGSARFNNVVCFFRKYFI